MLAGEAGQLSFSFFAGFHVDELGQPSVKAADHRHMASSDATGSLCLGGRG